MDCKECYSISLSPIYKSSFLRQNRIRFIYKAWIQIYPFTVFTPLLYKNLCQGYMPLLFLRKVYLGRHTFPSRCEHNYLSQIAVCSTVHADVVRYTWTSKHMSSLTFKNRPFSNRIEIYAFTLYNLCIGTYPVSQHCRLSIYIITSGGEAVYGAYSLRNVYENDCFIYFLFIKAMKIQLYNVNCIITKKKPQTHILFFSV